MFGFEKLEIYQLGKSLVIETYRLVALFPADEKFALGQQLRRAAVSVPSNIAEGYTRTSHRDKIHFFNIANGSLMETVCQIEIAAELGYLQENDVRAYLEKTEVLSNKIKRFSKSIAMASAKL